MPHFSTWGLPGQSLLQGLIINRWYETLWSPEAVLNNDLRHSRQMDEPCKQNRNRKKEKTWFQKISQLEPMYLQESSEKQTNIYAAPQ